LVELEDVDELLEERALGHLVERREAAVDDHVTVLQ
jgi:hypothetical protein